MKIVTLLPSATDIVCALGAGEQLVGVSHSCESPGENVSIARVTSTRVPYQASSIVIDDFVREHLQQNSALYDLHIDKLAELQPDVLVSQALCDVCAVATGDVQKAIDTLPRSPQVVDLNPSRLDDVLADIARVAAAIEQQAAGEELLASLCQRRAAVNRLAAKIPAIQRPRVAFVEWLIPPFNGGHWNPELVVEGGGIDVLGDPGRPSRSLQVENIRDAKPDVLFFAACGFDVERTCQDIELLTENAVWRRLLTDCDVYVADGDRFFARPGHGLIDGLEIIAHALHPRIFPEPANAARQLDFDFS